jgi:PAS domain-containing protein
LTTTQERVNELQGTLSGERQAYERAHAASASELQRMTREHDQLRGSFDGLQSAFQMIEQTAAAHVAECTRLGGSLSDRERELDAQGERHRKAEQEAHSALAQLRAERDASTAHAETLRRDAARLPELEADLETSRKERRRDFERAPYGLCRCTADGVIAEANHSFLGLFGRRRVDNVLTKNFTTAVFDCAGDVAWLLDRARSTRKTETTETGWTPADGRHLVIRLQALAASTGAIEIVAEDITEIRALEERLRRAQRMEAVGRLASEVAVRCDVLLGDVVRGLNDCVAAFPEHDGLRARGERLVTDAVQVGAYVRQLAAYGDSQASALEPVSAQRILQDLAPVLKRLVGDRVELTLSKSSGFFPVDVSAERLERILVNVAGYARQRMSAGGLMRIDLATTAVGRRFVARHPHVRPGDHVLITVTELPHSGGVAIADPNAQCRDQAGVDLAALVELIGTCGGHLWMEAQPAGNIVVKIHLPKRAPAGHTRTDRGGRLARWFRSASPTAMRA